MKAISIDLGSSPGKPEPISNSLPDKFYPTLHLEGPEMLDLPKSGTLKIKYKKIRSEKAEADGKPAQYSCTIEVRKIVGVEARRPAPDVPDNLASEAALDALAKALMTKGTEEPEDYEDYED